MKRAIKRLLGALVPARALSAVAHASLGALDPRARKRWLRIYNGADVRWSLATLRELGFRPAAIVDVGACAGDFSAMARNEFPESAVLMCEAREAQRATLVAAARRLGGAVDVAIALLGPEPRANVAFHETGEGSGSSVMRELGDVPGTTSTLPMITLDGAVAMSGVAAALRAPVLLKLDVQGYEREVLRGGSATLAASEVVLLELSIQRLNDGAPLASELVAFMAERGMQLFDIVGFWRDQPTDALLQIDAVFVRQSSPLAHIVQRLPAAARA